ncbi:MAG: hypothetical protein IPO63_09780 [Bacteroidetes bacterium]|nr:hypothetical protein [Bacteroidota bacterium]
MTLNCGGIIWVQIDQTSGANLGAYSLVVTQNNFNGFVCNSDSTSASLVQLTQHLIKIMGI